MDNKNEKAKFVQRNVSLDQESYKVIEDLANELMLGQRGFSAALRIIIQVYAESKNKVKVA